LNINAEARDKKAYPNVLAWAMFMIVVVFNVNSVLSYFTFGNGVKDFTTLNLVPMNSFAIFIIALFCVNALTSYPIQVLAVFDIIEEHPYFNQPLDTPLRRTIKIQTERSLIILLVTMVCAVIPNFLDFLNITGSIGASSIAFILPAMAFLTVIKERSRAETFLNVFIIVLGVFGACFSLYISISNMVS
jgi:amino acid permease